MHMVVALDPLKKMVSLEEEKWGSESAYFLQGLGTLMDLGLVVVVVAYTSFAGGHAESPVESLGVREDYHTHWVPDEACRCSVAGTFGLGWEDKSTETAQHLAQQTAYGHLMAEDSIEDLAKIDAPSLDGRLQADKLGDGNNHSAVELALQKEGIQASVEL